MADIPKTSTTLLNELACDTQHARWGEFVAALEKVEARSNAQKGRLRRLP